MRSAALASQIVTRMPMSATDVALAAIRLSLAGLGKAAAGGFAAAVLNFSATGGTFYLLAIVSAGG